MLCAGSLCAVMKGRQKNFADVDGYYPVLNLNSVKGLTIFFIVVGLILGLAYTGENPFVYFQF